VREKNLNNLVGLSSIQKARLESLIDLNISPLQICEAKPFSGELKKVCDIIIDLYQADYPTEFVNLPEHSVIIKVADLQKDITAIIDSKYIIIKKFEVGRGDIATLAIVEEEKDKVKAAIKKLGLSHDDGKKLDGKIREAKIYKAIKYTASMLAGAKNEQDIDVQHKLQAWLEEATDCALEMVKRDKKRFSCQKHNISRHIETLAVKREGEDGLGILKQRDLRHPAITTRLSQVRA